MGTPKPTFETSNIDKRPLVNHSLLHVSVFGFAFDDFQGW
jgi:hypothetical protein